MELEELKAEAEKLGYKLVKKQESTVLLPCTCDRKKPHEWIQVRPTSGYFYRCEYCYKRTEPEKTRIAARKAWNQMILTEGKSSNA